MDDKTETQAELVRDKEEKFQLREREIVLNSGEAVVLPSMHIEKMRLYHGSPVSGIQQLKESEDTTLGFGIYLTSQKEAATGYAIVRGNRGPKQPTVYEAEIGDVDILNLTTQSSIDSFAKYFEEELTAIKEKRLTELGYIDSYYGMIVRALEVIRNSSQDNPIFLKKFLWNFQDVTKDVVVKKGYDGLMAYEGGESGNGVTIGDHDSFVIFKPEKVKVIKEEPAVK